MIVVTGGDGFIGSNLIERIESDTGEEALCVDYLNNRRSRHWCHPADFLSAKHYLEKTKVIFHNGACSDTTNNDPFYVIHKNFDYSVELLKRCIQHEIRLIYASSASVYGRGGFGFGESCRTFPLNLYASSKAMFDDYSMVFSDHLPQLASLRYFNVYGRNEERKGDMASVVYKWYQQNKKFGEISLFENSEFYMRDFIHIDDVINIAMNFYHQPNSGIYNVGTGLERSFLEIANIFAERYGSEIKQIPMPEHLKDKYQTFTVSNNDKISKTYDIKYTTLEDGVNKYLDFLESRCE